MTGDRAYWSVLVPIAVVAVIAALSLASSVFAPIAFALFIIAITWPLQRRLQSVMPKLLALAFTALVVVTVLIAFGSLITWAASRVARSILADAARYQMLYEQLVVWLEGHGIAINALWAEHFNVSWLLRALQGITGRLNSTVSFWVVVLVYVTLGLLEVSEFGERLRKLGRKDIGDALLAGCIETAAKIRRYMLVRTGMSLLTGVLVWGFANLMGLNLAKEWGVIAFTLNYIPFLGALIATVFPAVFALAQFESWQAAVAVFAGLNIIQFMVGSYIEPRVSGNALSISPSIILFSVFFWSFLWGIFGAFIGVPIMIAVLTFCGRSEATRWVADLLGMGERRPETTGRS